MIFKTLVNGATNMDQDKIAPKWPRPREIYVDLNLDFDAGHGVVSATTFQLWDQITEASPEISIFLPVEQEVLLTSVL